MDLTEEFSSLKELKSLTLQATRQSGKSREVGGILT
jgi:hypothetical protein